MTNLTNRFIAIGSLSEIKANIYPSHLRVKLSVRIGDYVVTIYHSVNRQFRQERYDDFCKLIPKLHGDVSGWVYANDKPYYEITSGEPTRLFISGNLTPKGDMVFFNAENIQLSNRQDDAMEITMQGVWRECGFMNIVADSPRVFNLPCTTAFGNQVYKLTLEYNCGYCLEKCRKTIIKSLEKCDKLLIKSLEKCDKVLSDEDIKQWELEWSIISA